MAYSIAFFKFKKALEREIRNYWTIAASFEFANSLMNSHPPKTLITEIGRNTSPFSYVVVEKEVFQLELPQVLSNARENALVNFVTAFEVYLYEIMARIIYIRPETMDDSELEFSVKHLVQGFNTTDYRLWFSEQIADRLNRGSQHSKLIARIAKMSKCDLKAVNKQLEEWNKWTYVRNSIVHAGRRVSSDLAEIWPDKFPNVGAKISFTGNELMKVKRLH